MAMKATGIAEIDGLLVGELFATVGRMTMYKAKRPYYATNQPTKNIDDITNKAEKITDSKNTKHVRNFLNYTGQFDFKTAFEAMKTMLTGFQTLICAGTVAGGIVIYIRK